MEGRSKEIKVGFAGVGDAGQLHMGRLSQIEGVKVTALCGAHRERAENAASIYGGKVYTNYQELLSKEDIDALYICVPPFAAGDIEMATVERGLPFFAEKPIALNLEKAKVIDQKIRARGIITSVGYQGRYADNADKLKVIMKSQKVGLVLGYWLGSVPDVEWWHNKETSGGQAVEQTTHIFDLARYFCGEVEKVQAFGAKGIVTEFENYNIEDTSAANLCFKSGAIGTIFSGCFLPAGHKVGIEIYTKELRAEYWCSLKITERDKTTEFPYKDDVYMKEDEVFIEAVRRKNDSGIKCNYSDALETLKLTLAVSESMEKGTEVRL